MVSIPLVLVLPWLPCHLILAHQTLPVPRLWARALVRQDHALAKLSMVNFLPQLKLSALHL